VPVHTATVEEEDVPTSPQDDAVQTANDRRDAQPGRRGTNVSGAEDPFQERITRLEARLADMPPDRDAHVNALHTGIRSLVAELVRRRRQTEETCDTLTRVLEATSDGFFALDPDSRFTYVNEHAGRIFDRGPASLIGKHLDRVSGRCWGVQGIRTRSLGGHLGKSGVRSTARSLVRAVFTVRRRPRGLLQDITHRKIADDRLRASSAIGRSSTITPTPSSPSIPRATSPAQRGVQPDGIRPSA
jgi:PAS domain-containing protein